MTINEAEARRLIDALTSRDAMALAFLAQACIGETTIGEQLVVSIMGHEGRWRGIPE